MSDSRISNEFLIGSPTQDEEAAAEAQESNLSCRACKITGLTLLACLLILGQVVTAYFLLNQRNDITALQEQSDKIRREMTIIKAVSVPIQLEMPEDELNTLTDVISKVVSAEVPDQRNSSQTECQLEAAGSKPVQVPGFHPACDELGLYQVHQCYAGQCWCVKAANGEVIPGSVRKGQASCSPDGESVNSF
ncbi:thyroglobulin-like [Gouania willdenowi]|uniref:Thyroglobulin-like n=1 Tax=Gouania willdenowi TaxID=441366 RepID=A0A8C5GXW1_GOUWI|nr:thyroglobulin-like [Gouania willdenowi]